MFVLLLIEMFLDVPCLLCGEIHKLHIHAKLARKVRSAETQLNITITIVAIICRKAKKSGKQYTKRILPPFVIPYCLIRRDYVWAYLSLYPAGGRLHAQIASEMLGTVDLRTMRWLIQQAREEITEVALTLTEFLSAIPSYATLPDRKVGEPDLKYLCAVAEEIDQAAERVRGGNAVKIPPLVYLHAFDVYRRAPPNSLKPSLTSVLKAAVFHDTSSPC